MIKDEKTNSEIPESKEEQDVMQLKEAMEERVRKTKLDLELNEVILAYLEKKQKDF